MTVERTRPGRPKLLRAGLVGAAITGGVGALTGLGIGVHVNAPTAPFAAIELGLPSAVLGFVAGTVVGAVIGWFR
jgi:hypothetical protein